MRSRESTTPKQLSAPSAALHPLAQGNCVSNAPTRRESGKPSKTLHRTTNTLTLTITFLSV